MTTESPDTTLIPMLTPREALIECLAQVVERDHEAHVTAYAVNRVKTYGWKLPEGSTGKESEPVSMATCIQASDAFDSRLREALNQAFDAGKKAGKATACLHQIAEPPAPQTLQPLEYSFFSHDSECGTEFHKTEAEAINCCEEALQGYREEAGEGWAEEVEDISWGVVLGRAVKCNAQPLPEHHEFAETCDYELKAATQPAAQGLDAQDAARYRSFLDGLKVGDKTICIYAMKDGFGTRLRTTAEIDAAIAAQAKQVGA